MANRYTVDAVVCDYGVFENGQLKLTCSNRRNALLIKDIMEKDDAYGQGFIQNPKYVASDFNKFISEHEQHYKLKFMEIKRPK